MIVFLACCLGTPVPVSLTSSDTIHVLDSHVRISDVLDTDTMDSRMRDHIGDMIIASHSGPQSHIILSRDDIRNLIRRRIPGLMDIGAGDPKASVRIEFENPDVLKAACFTYQKSVEKGQAISGEDLKPIICNNRSRPEPVEYEKMTGVVRAKGSIAVGSYAGRLSVPRRRFADKGDELLLRVAIGPVQIEKTVWALQPANNAKTIFVEDRAGNVMRVPIKHPETVLTPNGVAQ